MTLDLITKVVDNIKIPVFVHSMSKGVYDLKTNSHRYVQWSGGDVLYQDNPEEKREEWNEMIEKLGLKNAKCVRSRIEDFTEQFDYITARAV